MPLRRAKKASPDTARKARPAADVDRLMRRLREANERLIVAAVHAQNLSDEAQRKTALARTELDDLKAQVRAAHARAAAAAAQDASGRLTPREREVLQLLAEGRSNKEVGVLLGITTKTAETHRTHILAKLDLHSMSELVRYAVRNHIIQA